MAPRCEKVREGAAPPSAPQIGQRHLVRLMQRKRRRKRKGEKEVKDVRPIRIPKTPFEAAAAENGLREDVKKTYNTRWTTSIYFCTIVHR